MVFWRRKAKEEEGPQIQTQFFSDFFHRIGNSLQMPAWKVNDDHALSAAEIKSRMAGVPIYKVSNHSDSSAAIFAHADPKRRLELHFFSKPDALDFFDRMKLYDEYCPADHWRIFDAPLSDVVVKEGEKAIRLVPESSQIKNALEVKKKTMADEDNFMCGVPVFKCDAFKLKIETRGNTDFRPVFLRKEDLEETITALDILPGNIEVASLEETIQEMKDSSTNRSNDLIFIGPGDSSKWLA